MSFTLEFVHFFSTRLPLALPESLFSPCDFLFSFPGFFSINFFLSRFRLYSGAGQIGNMKNHSDFMRINIAASYKEFTESSSSAALWIEA